MKDNKNNKSNKDNMNDGAGSRDMHRIWAKLFRKLQKHWKVPGRPGRAGKMNFCPEMHQQGFMNVIGCNKNELSCALNYANSCNSK